MNHNLICIEHFKIGGSAVSAWFIYIFFLIKENVLVPPKMSDNSIIMLYTGSGMEEFTVKLKYVTGN